MSNQACVINALVIRDVLMLQLKIGDKSAKQVKQGTPCVSGSNALSLYETVVDMASALFSLTPEKGR